MNQFHSIFMLCGGFIMFGIGVTLIQSSVLSIAIGIYLGHQIPIEVEYMYGKRCIEQK